MQLLLEEANKCIKKIVFPQIWKEATIARIPKAKADLSHANDREGVGESPSVKINTPPRGTIYAVERTLEGTNMTKEQGRYCMLVVFNIKNASTPRGIRRCGNC